MKVTYELHALSKGEWNIDRVFDGASKEQALKDARLLYREPHITGVKVICETYNEDTNQSSEVVLYDTTRESGKPVEVKKPKPAPAKPAAAPAAKPQGGVARPAPQKAAKKPMSTTSLVALSVVLVAAVAVLMVVLSRGAEVLSSL